jgi:hypothetical protein
VGSKRTARLIGLSDGKVINAKDYGLARLSDIHVNTKDAKKIYAAECIQNLIDAYKFEEINFDQVIDKKMLAELIAPNHTEDFKEYHAKRVVRWYNSIVHSLSRNKDGIVQ